MSAAVSLQEIVEAAVDVETAVHRLQHLGAGVAAQSAPVGGEPHHEMGGRCFRRLPRFQGKGQLRTAP